MYEIKNFDYHYYDELTDWLDTQKSYGYTFIHILEKGPSGDQEKMHRVAVIFIKKMSFRIRLSKFLSL